ncbi:MAG: protein kinase, partial [Acidobacteriota bacterium]
MREPPKDDRPPLGRSPQPESLPPTADWAEVESLLHLALEKEPDEIEAFLAEACLGRPELHAEVASLIGAYHQPPNLLQRETLVEPFSMAPGFSRGQRVGPYRILEAIGRGGMGTVFLAERDHEDFSQKVALKVVELRSPRLSQRLASEGRILAGLSHPNIAQFFDVGIAPSGIPFLAMEWVPGQDLLTYCDQRRADLDERLDLFETICGAVIYAHRNLVVHRDLKPSN